MFSVSTLLRSLTHSWAVWLRAAMSGSIFDMMRARPAIMGSIIRPIAGLTNAREMVEIMKYSTT